MALFKWGEITTKAWLFSLAIVAVVLFVAWPVIETSGKLIQFLWVAYTSDWPDGGFERGVWECVRTLSILG